MQEATIHFAGSSEQSASCFVLIYCEIVLFCPWKNLCRYGCMHFLAAFVLVSVDVMVMSSELTIT